MWSCFRIKSKTTYGSGSFVSSLARRSWLAWGTLVVWDSSRVGGPASFVRKRQRRPSVTPMQRAVPGMGTQVSCFPVGIVLTKLARRLRRQGDCPRRRRAFPLLVPFDETEVRGLGLWRWRAARVAPGVPERFRGWFLGWPQRRFMGWPQRWFMGWAPCSRTTWWRWAWVSAASCSATSFAGATTRTTIGIIVQETYTGLWWWRNIPCRHEGQLTTKKVIPTPMQKKVTEIWGAR